MKERMHEQMDGQALLSHQPLPSGQRLLCQRTSQAPPCFSRELFEETLPSPSV